MHITRYLNSRRMLFGAVLIMVGGATAAEAALQPPTGYFSPVVINQTNSPPCLPPPPPFTKTLDFPSKYQGSDEERIDIDLEAQAQYVLQTKAITDMEKGLSLLITRYMDTGDKVQLTCALKWLSTWAGARAMYGTATTHTGRSMRKWCLASLSSAYLRLKFSSSKPLLHYPAQATRIETWFSEVADRVKPEWPPTERPDKFNNHFYWSAWALMATAVATNRQDLFDAGATLYHVFAAQVDPEGYLPNELARGSGAAGYHSYAMLPISMVAAFGRANGVDLASEGNGALSRLAVRAQAAIENPSSFAEKAGAAQSEQAESTSAWAWLEPYCWTVSCTPEQRALLLDHRPARVTRLGGNITSVFSGAVVQ